MPLAVSSNHSPPGQTSPATVTSEPFDAFYRRCYPRMRGLAYVMTGAASDLDELLQDAFTCVYPRYASGELVAPDFYLKQAVINRCRRWRHRRAVDRARIDAVSVDDGPEIEVPHQPVFEDTVETRDALWAALDLLGSDHRTAVVLRYYEDLSFEQIAELMSTDARPVAVATVRSWVHRALAKLVSEVRQ